MTSHSGPNEAEANPSIGSAHGHTQEDQVDHPCTVLTSTEQAGEWATSFGVYGDEADHSSSL